MDIRSKILWGSLSLFIILTILLLVTELPPLMWMWSFIGTFSIVIIMAGVESFREVDKLIDEGYWYDNKERCWKKKRG